MRALSLLCRCRAEPVVLAVGVDGDIAEAGGGEVAAEFIGRVGVHAVNHLLPLLVVAGEAVVLVDDEEAASLLGTRRTPRKHSSIPGQK